MFEALFSAKGRMRRRDWWLWLMALSLAIVFSEYLMHRFFGTASFKEDLAFKGGPVNGLHYWLIFLGTVGQWPTICLVAKRWHDRNRPGWLAAIGPAIYLPRLALLHWGDAAGGFAPQFAVGVAQVVLGAASVVFGLWVLVDCGILDGTQGANKYGPSPKGVGAQPEDVF